MNQEDANDLVDVNDVADTMAKAAVERWRRTGTSFTPDYTVVEDTLHTAYEAKRLAAAENALAQVEDAGLLDRARVLVVRCENYKRVGLVTRTLEGLVLHGKGPLVSVDVQRVGGETVPGPEGDWVPGNWSYSWQRTHRLNRRVEVCVFLDDLVSWFGGRQTLQCECHTKEVYGLVLKETIKSGKRTLRLAST